MITDSHDIFVGLAALPKSLTCYTTPCLEPVAFVACHGLVPAAHCHCSGTCGILFCHNTKMCKCSLFALPLEREFQETGAFTHLVQQWSPLLVLTKAWPTSLE